MAEFQVVMKQVKRMCKEFGNDCAGCGLASSHCPLGPIPQNWDGVNFANVERIVMDWAAKHPEPRYPTWKEWQDTNFPNNDALMRPCIFESEEYFGCSKLEIGCEKCMNKPIPADIAEKLGIKPIGAKNDG